MRTGILGCVIAMAVIMLLPCILQAAQEPGPALRDGSWVCGDAKPVVTKEKVVLKMFSRQSCWRAVGSMFEKAAVIRFGGEVGELVLKGWGAREDADGVSDSKGAVMALHLNDGSWAIGEPGKFDFAFTFSLDAVSQELLAITIRIELEGDKFAEREFWFGTPIDESPAV